MIHAAADTLIFSPLAFRCQLIALMPPLSPFSPLLSFHFRYSQLIFSLIQLMHFLFVFHYAIIDAIIACQAIIEAFICQPPYAIALSDTPAFIAIDAIILAIRHYFIRHFTAYAFLALALSLSFYFHFHCCHLLFSFTPYSFHAIILHIAISQ
jgi:hypothetical protein